MSTWVPVITAGSLDGFIAGTLVTGACFLAVLAVGRARQRDLEADESLEPLMEVVGLADLMPEAEDPVVPAEETAPPDPLPAAHEHLAAVSDAEGAEKYDADVSDHLAALGAARRWQEAAAGRRDEQVPGAARAGWPAERSGALPARPPRPREPSALDGYGPAPTGALPDKPAQGGRHGRPGGHRSPHPLGDPTLGSAEGMPLPPGARRPPRHAAPAPSLGGKVTGLFATRSAADSSRG